MIKRIELTNFMSHEHTVIEPAPGLTVLVGPNNCGKSAVVAALQILCHNENSTYVLRHGERECSVKIETDDGHTVEWRRKTAPSYLIDGKLFDRLRGTGLPEELHQALRMPKVDAGDDADFEIHFGTQKSPVFLLGNSAANAARFFASSSDAIRLVQMQKLHKEKMQEAQREKNGLEAESRRVNAELTALNPVVELDGQVKALEADCRILSKLNESILGIANAASTLESQAIVVARHVSEVQALSAITLPPTLLPTQECADLLEKLVSAEAERSSLGAEDAVLASLDSPPVMSDTASLQALCEELNGQQRSVATTIAQQQSLHALEAPPKLADIAGLEATIESLGDAERFLQLAAGRNFALQTIATPPHLADESQFASFVSALEMAAEQVQHCRHQIAAVSALEQPPVVADTSALEAVVRQLDVALNELEVHEAKRNAAMVALQQAEDALRLASADGLCPICGGQLDADRLLMIAAGSGEHDHG